MKYEKIIQFIQEGWDKTVRFNPTDVTPEGEDTLLALPYPYTVPCQDGYFQEMYYWDTYFTNKGLLASGRTELAKNNCSNLLYMANKFGFVLNGNRERYKLGSQPPYLSLMTYDVYQKTGDKAWLKDAYDSLLKEYEFWQTQRLAPNGLNRYDTMARGAMCSTYVPYVRSRTRLPLEGDEEYIGRCYRAEGESGWDFTWRFHGKCIQYNPVDLNSNLYAYERLFGFYEKELGISTRNWAVVAEKRKQLMDKYLYDAEKGYYTDYNFIDGTLSDVLSCASFQPYFTGVSSDAEGAKRVLSGLKTPYGLVATDYKDGYFQWGYPNGWAPLHYVAVTALDRCGLTAEASSVAAAYCETVFRCFNRSGHLFEKYNMQNGTSETLDEYELPHMLGWSAGVFLALLPYLQSAK